MWTGILTSKCASEFGKKELLQPDLHVLLITIIEMSFWAPWVDALIRVRTQYIYQMSSKLKHWRSNIRHYISIKEILIGM